jgi:hypothetical protein
MTASAEFRFKLHDRVQSVACGTREPFSGTVVERFMSGTDKVCYTVRDDAGCYWHRNHEDLSNV